MSDGRPIVGAEVEIRQFVEAAPEVVFELLVDPEQFITWQGIAARFDPRPGGEFWLNVTGQDIAAGQFVEIDRPNRIVFTWGWEAGRSPLPPGSTTVEITLTPSGAGTDVVLRHLGLPPNELGHEAGHRHYLSRLALRAERGDPGPDSWLRPRPMTIDQNSD